MRSLLKWIVPSFIACSSLSLSGVEKGMISEQTLNLAFNNNAFALDLYHQLNDASGNLCFSPYSISSALAMVFNGANGETKDEMRDVLHFKAVENSLNEGFSFLNHFLSKTSPEITSDFRIDLANSLWIQSNFQIVPEFLDVLGKYFKTTLHKVDFLRQKELARRDINEEVREKTRGKITDLIQSNDIQESTKLVLVSVLYMKAKWERTFEKGATRMEPFFTESDKTITVPMMTDTAFYPYYKSDNYAAIELSYIQPKENMPDLKMLMILPEKNFGIYKLEKSIDAEFFKNLIQRLKSEEITLIFPKFKFVMSFNLKDVLIKMGMKNAFSTQADFSALSKAKDLYLGSVQHKVFIEVDENGTEAAAATAVSMNTKAIFRTKDPELFKADHPFMFLIYEKSTETLLFCGRIVNPLESF